MKTMFKVGNKVEILEGDFKGKKGWLVGSDYSGLKFRVELNNGLACWFRIDQIKLIEDYTDYGEENNIILNPNHYKTKNGDLFDEWYERYPFETFRIVLLATAERYFRRYHLKDGVDGLSKGIEVMKRLREYELKEQNND